MLENCYYLEGTAKLALPGEQTDDPTTLEEMSGETALGVMGLDLDIWMAREETADQEEHSEVETLGETGPGVKVEPAEETKQLPPGPIISGNRNEWTGPGAAAAQAAESDMAPENAEPADTEAGHTEPANVGPAEAESENIEPTNAGDRKSVV